MTTDSLPPWHDRLSLRFRLNLMIVLTMLLIIGLGFIFAIHNARRSVEEEVGAAVNLAIQLIEVGLAEQRDTSRPMASWLAQLGRLDQTRHLHITVRQTPDTVINLPERQIPEDDPAPGWFVWAVGPVPALVERTLNTGTYANATLLVAADAGDEIAEAWRETRSFLALIVLLAALVYGLVHVTIGRAFRSVESILGGLEGIKRGEYEQRLAHFPLPEFERISEAFNHMAVSLEKARDENRALTQQTLSIQEEERRHLAQEVHDELGQSLTAIKVMAASLRRPDESGREAVDQIMAICDRLFGVVRGMMRRLRPTILDDLGLAASLEDLVETWRNRHPGLELDFSCDPAVDELAGPARIHLFRIVQEGLTNIVKHAAASKAWITLESTPPDTAGHGWIRLEIRDDGRGFDSGQPRRGFGLLGIRERVSSLGGQFRLETAPGTGVCIDARVPCKPEENG